MRKRWGAREKLKKEEREIAKGRGRRRMGIVLLFSLTTKILSSKIMLPR